jgi:hypothetical protein
MHSRRQSSEMDDSWDLDTPARTGTPNPTQVADIQSIVLFTPFGMTPAVLILHANL